MGGLGGGGGGTTRRPGEQEVFLGPGTSCAMDGTAAGDNPGTVLPSSQEVILVLRHTFFLFSKEARRK